MLRAIVFDTETTGKKDPELIEAAWVRLSNLTPLTISESFNQRYRPNKTIELGAIATHHILDEELINCPLHTEFQLPQDVAYLIGHNIDYDWNVIGKPNIKRICTLALARKVWPNLDSHSQSALLYFVDRNHARDKLKNAHSALADVENCAFILDKICSALKVTSIEDLYNISENARIPSLMNFGKHKGAAITDIPKDYKEWLLKQADLDPYLKKALES